MTVPPKARVPAPHYHRELDEVVHGLDGTLAMPNLSPTRERESPVSTETGWGGSPMLDVDAPCAATAFPVVERLRPAHRIRPSRANPAKTPVTPW